MLRECSRRTQRARVDDLKNGKKWIKKWGEVDEWMRNKGGCVRHSVS